MSAGQAEWQRLPLGELSNVDSGFAFKSEDFQSANACQRFMPVIRMSDLKGGRLQIEEAARVDIGKLKGLERYSLQTADFLFGMSGSLSNYAVVRESDLPAVLNQRVGRLRAKPEYCQEFINYSFLSESVQAAIWEMATGAAQLNISIADVRNFSVPVPPLREQQKIAAILTAVDDKLDVIARQISATQTLKQGLMQTLFTRGAGTPDAQGRWHPHTEFQDTELGRIPVGWRVAQLQELGTVIRGASPRPQGDSRYYGGNVPRLMGADVTRDGKWVTPKIDFLTEAGAKLSRPCPKGTLTVICSGDVGIPAFLAVDACIHDGFLALINIDDESVSKDYLYHIIFSLKQRLDSSATHGGVFTNLTTSIFKEFQIPLPSLVEQRRIAEALDAMDNKLSTLTTKQTHYQSLKRGLMQKLLTGEWRVRVPASGYNS